MTDERGSFSGKLGFIMAVASSAIGLGSIWRFPYLVSKNGGGLFLVLYIAITFVFGLSLLITEVALGRKTGCSAPRAFCVERKGCKWIGWIDTAVPIIILSFYCVVGGWLSMYLFRYVTGNVSGLDDPEYFREFMSFSGSGILENPVFWFVIFFAVTVAVVKLGVQNGIEKLSKILIPALLFLIIALCAYVMTVPGIMDGVRYYIVPDMDALSGSILTDAVGQVFFSMSLCSGCMITYGSYMKKDVDIVRSLTVVALVGIAVAFLSGLLIIPITHINGFESAYGPGLIFSSLPQIFGTMEGGTIVGAVFFILVFFAAITSAISLLEASVSALCDNFGWTRGRSISIMIAICGFLGLLAALGYGPLNGIALDLKGGAMSIFDMMDSMTSIILLPLAGILTCIFIGYLLKPKYIIDEIEESGGLKWKKVYIAMIKYVSPLLLAAIFVAGIVDKFV